MSDVPCAQSRQAMKAFMAKDKEKDTVPESEALWFYGMNHGVALISAKPRAAGAALQWELQFRHDLPRQ